MPIPWKVLGWITALDRRDHRTQQCGELHMHENWIAFFAGAAWLAVFTAGLFAFANWVQRRDRRRRDEQDRAHYDRRP